jgi:hypothetical protein
VPRDVTYLALHHQRILRLIAARRPPRAPPPPRRFYLQYFLYFPMQTWLRFKKPCLKSSV